MLRQLLDQLTLDDLLSVVYAILLRLAWHGLLYPSDLAQIVEQEGKKRVA